VTVTDRPELTLKGLMIAGSWFTSLLRLGEWGSQYKHMHRHTTGTYTGTVGTDKVGTDKVGKGTHRHVTDKLVAFLIHPIIVQFTYYIKKHYWLIKIR